MAARSLTFWLPVAKWLCHISVSRSPSGSGPSSMRKIHHALRRSGSRESTAASAIVAEARSNSAAAPAGSIRPARSRSTLASGPSSRSRRSSSPVAANPARRWRWTTRRRSQGDSGVGR